MCLVPEMIVSGGGHYLLLSREGISVIFLLDMDMIMLIQSDSPQVPSYLTDILWN